MSKRIMFQIMNSSGRVDTSVGRNAIDEKEILSLNKHFDTIFFLQPIAYSYDCIKRNLTDLNSFIDRLSGSKNDLFDGMINHSEALNSMSEIQQRVINFLSSANTFLTLTESKLKSKHEKTSEKISLWNDFKRGQHSNNSCYRLMYELRNYALHYGLPVSSIKLSMNGLASENPQSEVRINLSKRKILDSGYDWKKIQNDIVNLENDNDLIELIREYSKVLNSMYVYLLNIFDSELSACKVAVDAFYLKHGIPINCTAHIISNWNITNDLSNFNYESLPTNELAWILSKNT